MVFLNKYTPGGMCTYNSMFDGDVIYSKLMSKGSVVAHDLADTVCPRHRALKKLKNENPAEFAQPSDKRMLELIKDMNLYQHVHYALIDNVSDIFILTEDKVGASLIKALNEKGLAFHLEQSAVDEFKKNKKAAYVFLLNKGAAWFVVVAYKDNNQLSFYISDRDHKAMQNYHSRR